jgi:hypothetical protein
MAELKDIRAICSQCGLECRRVASIMREDNHGDMAAFFIVARQFVHIVEDGNRKICRENMPHPWLMTLCGTEEVREVRERLARQLSKWDVGAIMRVG